MDFYQMSQTQCTEKIVKFIVIILEGSKDMFRISSGTQTFSNISARIWNSLMVNLDIDVSLIKFKESLKQYLLNNVLIIKYTK